MIKTPNQYATSYTCNHFTAPRFASGCLTCLTKLIEQVIKDCKDEQKP